MKHLVLLLSSLFILFSCTNARADDYDRLNLTQQQKAEIQKLKRDASYEFQRIGRSNMPGQEKGYQKKQVALELKNSIRKVLTSDQQNQFESLYGSFSIDSGTRDIIKDEYDQRLDDLEDQYDDAKDRIEDDWKLSKSERKQQIKDLKRKYKEDKNQLKRERDEVLRTL